MTRSTVGENVRRLRKAEGLGQGEFAETIGMSQGQLSDIENGRSALPDTATLMRIAKGLQRTIDDLLVGVDADYDRARHGSDDVEPEIIDVSGYVKDDIPVVAEGEASPEGTLFWDEEGRLKSEVTDRVSRPFDLKDPRAYGLRVRGDSMLPVFRPGMVLIVSPNFPVRDGDEGYVQLHNGERLVKFIRRLEGGWLLESANPIYPARFVKADEVKAIHTVMYSRRAYRGVRNVEEQGP